MKRKTGSVEKRKSVREELDGIKNGAVDYISQCETCGGRVLSFDIATERTGYAVLEGGRVVESGVLTAAGRLASDRFEKMADGILGVLRRTSPGICVAEAPFSGKNRQTAVYLNRLHGVLEYGCAKEGAKYCSFAIPSWRSEMGFPNNIRKPAGVDFKALSKLAAEGIVGRGVEDDNEADAICIGTAYLRRAGSVKKNKNFFKKCEIHTTFVIFIDI